MMTYRSTLLTVFSLALFHIPICAVQIELFSVSWDGDNLKIKVLSNTAYDQKKAEKEAEEIKNNEQKIKTNSLESKKIAYEIEKAEKRIAEKRRLLEKMMSELENGK